MPSTLATCLSHSLPDGRKLGYAIYGSSTPTSTILYMHGIPGSRLEGAYWHEQALQSGIRLVCPDRPGIGLSSTSTTGSLLDFAADCLHLLHSLQVKQVSLLGYSGGAAAALACAKYFITAQSEEKPDAPMPLTSVGIVAGMAPYEIARQYLSLPQKVIVNLAWYAPALAARLVDLGIGRCARDARSGDPEAEKAFSDLIARSIAGLEEHSKAVFHDNPECQQAFAQNLQEAYCGAGETAAVLRDAALLVQDWGIELSKLFSAGSVDLKLWYGADDANVRAEMGKELASYLGSKGQKVKYSELKGQTHFSMIPEHGAAILSSLIRV